MAVLALAMQATAPLLNAVIRNTSRLSAADRAAMAVYLKSLPSIEGPPRPTKAE